MYAVNTSEVIILDRVQKNPEARKRLERMLAVINTDKITEVDDAGLSRIVEERGWRNAPPRTGQRKLITDPVLIFSTFRWFTPAQLAQLEQQYPNLRPDLLLGQQWNDYRDHTHLRREQDCICQSAYEIHCAHGCLHACDYCFIPSYFNIMLNLEELAEEVRKLGDRHPQQKLYKFDNRTDTIALEPEYGASDVMVNMFADWGDRYLLLYTKSANVDHLLDLKHNGHTLISWSLNSDTPAEKIERNTPTLDERITAIEKCQEAGYGVRVRFSPMVPVRNWKDEYADMVERVLSRTRPEVISLDIIGWMQPADMKDALDINLFDPEYADMLQKRIDDGFHTPGKHLFPHEMRSPILRHVIECVKKIRPEQPISLCMETADMWKELGSLTNMRPNDYACVCGPTSVPGNHNLLPVE